MVLLKRYDWYFSKKELKSQTNNIADFDKYICNNKSSLFLSNGDLTLCKFQQLIGNHILVTPKSICSINNYLGLVVNHLYMFWSQTPSDTNIQLSMPWFVMLPSVEYTYLNECRVTPIISESCLVHLTDLFHLTDLLAWSRDKTSAILIEITLDR